MANDVAVKIAQHDITLTKKKKKTLFPQAPAQVTGLMEYDTKGFTLLIFIKPLLIKLLNNPFTYFRLVCK